MDGGFVCTAAVRSLCHHHEYVYTRLTLGVTLTSTAEHDQHDGQDKHDAAADARYYDDRLH